ncbi:hypothetical protein FHI69_01600 [Janthinobacterium lividum]|uniref:Uncharacterized protein n=1 Tax=Janthinobacterium lividum TaxID=29581 RepID=A0A5C4P0T4_9BURK|nr:hypothetical protein FHI69_01600 [Janthinobacterium lividum]
MIQRGWRGFVGRFPRSPDTLPGYSH